MKKILFTLLFLGLTTSLSFGQEITEGTLPFMRKVSGNGLSIVLEGQKNNVEDVLDKKFSAETGSKRKKVKGISAFEGVRMSDISSSTMDVYYNVEKVSNTSSRATIFLSAGNYNFLDSETYPEEMEAMRRMMSGLQLETTIYELELAISEQEKTIDKAIKEHTRMEKDSVSLEKKLAETIQAIEQNKVDRSNQLVQIDEEKARLEEFKAELDRLRRKED